jgi:hypothetical protein
MTGGTARDGSANHTLVRRSECRRALELGDQSRFIEIGKHRSASQCGVSKERHQQREPQRDEYAGEPDAGFSSRKSRAASDRACAHPPPCAFENVSFMCKQRANLLIPR